VKQTEKRSEAINEFARFAYSYDTFNMIQKQVSLELASLVPNAKYNTILDIGCGSGSMYKHIVESGIHFKNYIALDASEEMLSLHPHNHSIQKICIDFDKHTDMAMMQISNDSAIVSSSALQWSKDLESLMRQTSSWNTSAYFAIFTDNTFKTLHKIAGIDSPIYGTKTLISAINKFYKASYKVKQYSLMFESTKDMFHYIKHSGVSGGEKQLGYKQMKSLMREYPLAYLEFEVLFVEATPL